MPAMGEWRTAIEAAISRDVADLTAVTFIDKLSTNAQPVKVIASDGGVYLIKGRQTRRVPVNEQIVAALAEALGAPVPPVMLIDLPAELIHAEPGMGHMEPGMSHASRWIDDCTDREGLRYFDVAENRPRFAALAVLYSWARASDHQWIYSKHHPNLVYSVDHGHFFPNGP